MDNPLVRKLQRFARLSTGDKQALNEAARLNVRRIGPREDIIREGESPDQVNLILSGWACRYKQLEDGRRQIIAFFLPGDLCDTHVFVMREMDHSIGTLSAVTVAEIGRDTLTAITEQHPRVTQALWWEMLVATAVQREWTVNIGQRTATERLGHLFCELFLRMRAVDLTDGTSCELPITQVDLADALGLSNVHVNRVLQELRANGLVTLRGRLLTIPDLPALKAASLFNPNYLHLDQIGRHLDANED
ncbi:Crp/Fnr family transcriptional regulator [Methylobacterium brachythecii]|uniref:CRP-like cAMP-binding protein n=1 Tax=Methylobacterium brachythecii TaxID=1176177 RepID=A0A7W6F6A5_9HYPH|nr:Crp/Fnr family transcriptional regulator [Methylobacterium brachythecii]MBB3901791.1 CRP-like cAMP-binding protein [Methylobacterium brachythecii]GLS43169.1 Crp/Fnr family transcriptional regulator [Methylobacterium brachythecii]